MRYWVLVFVAWAALLGQAASAQEWPLDRLSCTGGAATQMAALALPPDKLDCGAARFARSERFVRLHTKLGAAHLPTQRLYLQTDPTSFDSMLLHLKWSDGGESWIDVDPQMAARHWAAGALFSVPLPRSRPSRRLASMDAVIEAPRMMGTLREARLVTATDAAREHYRRSLFGMLAIGMMLVPVLYTAFYYRRLRAPFILWHAGLAGAAASFVFFYSGLVFSAFPQMPLALRWQFNSLTLVVMLTCTVFFTLSLVERGLLKEREIQALGLSLLPLLATKILLTLDTEALRYALGRFAALSLVPLAAALPIVLWNAMRRGSRAAMFLLIGFAPSLLALLVAVTTFIGVARFGRLADDIMIVTLVFSTFAASLGVGDRFMIMRMQYDRERRRAAMLGAMAYTDALTGLGNRRAFDKAGILEAGQGMLVADLDHFKAINDTLGHAAGDAALCRFARTLRAATQDQPDAALYRLGGEEFGVILPAGERRTILQLCETIREAVARQEPEEGSGARPLTVSVGATLGRGQSVREAFAEADAAMYEAKQLGRDRCRLAGDAMPESEIPTQEQWEARRSRI